MLETVKTFIRNLPDKPFEEFFNEYMMSVQDRTICDEVDITLKRINNDVLNVGRIVENEYEGLVDDNDKC